MVPFSPVDVPPVRRLLEPEPGTVAERGFAIRRRVWGLSLIHGCMALGAALDRGRAIGPHGVLGWLDTETTGLAGGTGTYVFLVGIGAIEESAFVVTQYFLADLGAEAAMLRAVAAHLNRLDALVTFNGLRFDLPLLQTRFLLSRLRDAVGERAHLDLITYARRLWYRPLGGYSLAAIEGAILQVERYLDVPGWLIPSLYVQYLRTGDPADVEPAFAHNEQDLLSLLALHGMTGDVLTRPDVATIAVDRFGLGCLLEQRGNAESAVRCYESNLAGESDPHVRWRTLLAVARHYRGRGQRDRLLGLWERELEVGVLPPWQALERLAMVWEWQLGDPQRALALAERALDVVAETETRPAARLRHRCARLTRKSELRSARAGGDRGLRAARRRPG